MRSIRGQLALVVVALTGAVVLAPSNVAYAGKPKQADIVVYSGTPSGVLAAVAAARDGAQVTLIEPRTRIGGMISGGLTKTDIGTPGTVGGLTREFFDRVLKYYVDEYGEDSEEVKLAIGVRFDTAYFFEPKIGQKVLEEMLADAKVKVVLRRRIVDVVMKGTRVEAIVVEDPKTGDRQTLAAKMFIDAGYEGDLMARAGVPYRVGREARSEYDESIAGINMGDPESLGKADHRIQAFNYRATLTDRPDVAVPFPKPDNYDASKHSGLVATVNARGYKTFRELWESDGKTMEQMHGGVNGKFDFNRGDMPGVNFTYPDGSYEERAAIEKTIRDNYLAPLYALQNDPRLSEEFRKDAMTWGLPKDEHTDSGHFPDQVYLREGRRMIGKYVVTQNDVEYFRDKPDTICQGSYNMDCHVVQVLGYNNRMNDEGHFNHSTDDYAIPYRAIVPVDHPNLLVPVCLSATHVALSSIRMEPVYMMLGEGAGRAAQLALAEKVPVQDITVSKLQSRLKKSGVPLKVRYRPTVRIASEVEQVAPGTTVKFEIDPVSIRGKIAKVWWNFDGSGAVQATDESPSYTFDLEKVYDISLLVEDADGQQSRVMHKQIRVGRDPVEDVELDFDYPQVHSSGRWEKGRYGGTYWRRLWQDMGEGKGEKQVTYRPVLPRSGRYLVAMAYSPQPKHASNVPVIIRHEGGETLVEVNQQQSDTVFPFNSLGTYRFSGGAGAEVIISNEGTREGEIVTANNIRFIWQGE